ncbi:MAG: AMP-binding protein [Dehalococcoidia bacterium]
MTINPFKPKPSLDPGAELLLTSETPLTIPGLLADARARFGSQHGFQQRAGGKWEKLDFEQLYRRAHDFGAGLIALGLQKGDRVAIIAENSLDWVVGYLGVSVAGGVGVPLYTELKRDEVESMVQRAGARFVIASTKVLSRLPERFGGAEKIIAVGAAETRAGNPPRFLRRGRPDLLPFDEVALRATDESRRELASRRIEPDDLASIVFTSGTTGGMKGVMLTHKNLTSNVESIRRTIQLDERDRIVLVLPLHHAFPFIIFLAELVYGGELTFENDLLRVRDRLKEVKPTLFLGVPALFEQVYRAILRRAEAEGRLETFERGLRAVDTIKRRTGVNLGRLIFREVHQQLGGNLRFVLSGAAALNPELARNFFRLGLPLLQGWGLSEASPAVAAQRFVPRKFLFSNYYEEHLGTVGAAVEGVEVKLIDVPEKEIYVHLHGEGELVVRGPNVFAGYWQSPKETADALAGGWLRTGDLGRIDEEGNIYITGRSKYVIVLDSGEKVVPDELEERFASSEVMQDVCVEGRRARNKTIVAAVVFPSWEGVTKVLQARGEDLSEASVRRVVQEDLDAQAKELAPHKRVSELVLTDTPLPKTAILKVKRGELPESYDFDVERWKQQAAGASLLLSNNGTQANEEEASEGESGASGAQG